MSETALFALIILATLVAALVIPHLMLRRAVPKVIKILRDHGAVDAEHAVQPEAVGLTPQTIFQRAMQRRDYKPRALMGLIQIGVVALCDDGSVYLSETALARSVFKDS